jgi:DUF2934 family protein
VTDPMQSQRIRERAYTIWADAGCPDGGDREHWLQAEAEIVVEEQEAVAAPAPASAVRRRTSRLEWTAAVTAGKKEARKLRSAAPRTSSG